MLIAGAPERMRRLAGPLHKLSFNKWYFDEIYNFIFVRRTFDFGHIFSRSDRQIIDRFGPDGSAKASSAVARMFSKMQSGYIYHYAFVMMIAVISVLSWFAFRAGEGG